MPILFTHTQNPLLERLDYYAHHRPNDIALQDTQGHHLTFANLVQGIAPLATQLAQQRQAIGTVLGLPCHDPISTVYALYAAWYAGVALFPYNADLPAAILTPLLRDAGVRAILCMTDATPALPGFAIVHGTRASIDILAPLPSHLPSLATQAVHLLVATSGTSGKPKAVALTGDNLFAAIQASQHVLPLQPGACWLSCLPLFHVGGLMTVLRAWQAGACVALHARFVSDAVVASLMQGVITHISLVPALLARVLDAFAARYAPQALQVALIGGGPLAPNLARRAHRLGWPLCVSYGMTETTALCASDCTQTAGLEAGCVGSPLPGFEIRAGTPAKPANIDIRGQAVCAGYMGRDSNYLPDGFWRTADLGFLDTQGRVWLVGRADDVLVTGGENVHPEPLEALLMEYTGMLDVAVCGRSDEVWGQRLVALVVADTLDREAFLSWTRTHLPSHLRPREVYHVEALPRTHSGKLIRNALTKMLAPFL